MSKEYFKLIAESAERQLCEERERAEAWKAAAEEMFRCAEYLWSMNRIEYHCDDEDCPGDDTCSCQEPDAVNRLLGSRGSDLNKARTLEGETDAERFGKDS